MGDHVYRGIVGAALAFVLIIAFQTYLVKVARKRAAGAGAGRHVVFMDLVVTSDDESYSLSRLQMYLWTVAVITGFAAVWAGGNSIPDIPQNLYLLMGVNLAASVASTAITTVKAPTAGSAEQSVGKNPDFFDDLFFESDASLDLPRTQMFIWTIVSLAAFAYLLIRTFSGTPALPDIPAGLVVLMGVSHGAYLGSKAVATASAPVVADAAGNQGNAPDAGGAPNAGAGGAPAETQSSPAAPQ